MVEGIKMERKTNFKFFQVLLKFTLMLCITQVIGDKYQFHEIGPVIVDSAYMHIGIGTDIKEMDKMIAAVEATINRIENDSLIAESGDYYTTSEEVKNVLKTQIETMKTMLKEVKAKYNEIKFLLRTAQGRHKRFLAMLGVMAIGSIVGFVTNGLWGNTNESEINKVISISNKHDTAILEHRRQLQSLTAVVQQDQKAIKFLEQSQYLEGSIVHEEEVLRKSLAYLDMMR